MDNETVVLPRQVELLSKLRDVCSEEAIEKNVYPVLLCWSGQEMTPEEFVLLMSITIWDYIKTPGTGLEIRKVDALIPGFVKAIFDNQGYEKAMRYYNGLHNLDRH